jgi:hypothetical protein
VAQGVGWRGPDLAVQQPAQPCDLPRAVRLRAAADHWGDAPSPAPAGAAEGRAHRGHGRAVLPAERCTAERTRDAALTGDDILTELMEAARAHHRTDR